jgi:septal ring factor EnvC (AmiA/AmiB activator)
MVKAWTPVLLAGLFATALFAQTANAQPSSVPDSIQARIDHEAAELERVRRELEKVRAEAKSLGARESQVLKQLNAIDSDLGLKERLLSGLQRKQARLGADLDRLQQRLEVERRNLEERRTVLRRRLRNIYKVGERPGLQVLLGATSAVDLVRRFDWLLLVAAQDRALFEDIQRSVTVVRGAEAELAQQAKEVEAVRRESEREKAELVRKKDERSSLLSSVRTQKEEHQNLIGELEEAERQVKGLLASLEERARAAALEGELPAGTGFAAAKGKLPWPVEGKVARWFGLQRDKRFGTSTFNGGIDIQAGKESDVVAVHSGRADYVNWLPGYGQCIILNHGDGYYTLYAHTSSVFVQPGDQVEGGEVIASVGNTGSLLGDVLHFEIRKDAERPAAGSPGLGQPDRAGSLTETSVTLGRPNRPIPRFRLVAAETSAHGTAFSRKRSVRFEAQRHLPQTAEVRA